MGLIKGSMCLSEIRKAPLQLNGYRNGSHGAELEGGLIEISEGFIGPVLFSIPLQTLESSSNSSSNAAGLLFFSLSEFGGKWRCRRLEKFCEPQLPSLMKLAKARKKLSLLLLPLVSFPRVALSLFPFLILACPFTHAGIEKPV